jgi:RimJ/RimL family protein N-acetyltransferase
VRNGGGIVIETERIIFRKYILNDLDFLLKMTSDPDVMKYIGNGTTWNEDITKERLLRFISWYQTREDIGLMLAVRKEDNIPIGHAGLVSQLIEEKQETEVGYWIAKEYWGNGYAKESAVAWKDYGIINLGKRRLVSIIQFDNKPSIQVAVNNGMAFEKEINFNSKNVALYSLENG